jgi:hypothetical protein
MTTEPERKDAAGGQGEEEEEEEERKKKKKRDQWLILNPRPKSRDKKKHREGGNWKQNGGDRRSGPTDRHHSAFARKRANDDAHAKPRDQGSRNNNGVRCASNRLRPGGIADVAYPEAKRKR